MVNKDDAGIEGLHYYYKIHDESFVLCEAAAAAESNERRKKS